MRLIGFRRAASALFLSVIVLMFTGCAGYRTGTTKPVQMQSVETLAVPVFKNLTLEPRSSVLITNMVVKQLHRDGTYRITAEEGADAILRGTIRQMERRQLRSAKFNTLRSRELNLRIFVDYVVEEPGTGLILAEGSVQGDTNVFIDRNFQLSDRQGIEDATRDLSRKLVARISEGW
ncbi:MAG: outer membrane lipopolysaccharide assembly protein LptE/RlpB [Verrucomicrobiales bacterium]|jgi:outer membrane lipopolysaccharide assembly protein LptE/RlpB